MSLPFPMSCEPDTAMSEHCCEQMAFHLAHEDETLHYSAKFREYAIPVHNGGSSYITIAFCPWCGTTLPRPLRDQWHQEIARLGLEPEHVDPNSDFASDTWWRSRQATPRLEYSEPHWTDRLSALRSIADPDNPHPGSAVIALGLNDPDPAFIEAFAIAILVSPAPHELRRCALLAIAHSARLHRRLAHAETRAVVMSVRDSSPSLAGAAEDALDDIATFAHG